MISPTLTQLCHLSVKLLAKLKCNNRIQNPFGNMSKPSGIENSKTAAAVDKTKLVRMTLNDRRCVTSSSSPAVVGDRWAKGEKGEQKEEHGFCHAKNRLRTRRPGSTVKHRRTSGLADLH